ncbi:MAG: PfaD family polyunsaturated fatty acid/polyketide biosynthesis protein [Planctomycetaceae bacterium]|nr:PfaD family polyunsaturated fatty acid/polyketide biosynthesis protein [Planctomycetaceae bacterium]
MSQYIVPPSLLGWWTSNGAPLAVDPESIAAAVQSVDQPLYIVNTTQGYALGVGGAGSIGPEPQLDSAYPMIGYVPPAHPENLGDITFCLDHGLRYPYASGGMAAGIGSADIVEEMARAGMIGIFGAAGLSLQRVEQAITRIQQNIPGLPYGFNLIHSPHDPSLERGVVELYIQRGVTLAEASAFMDLTINVVRFRTHGIHRGPNGEVVTPNRVMAKVSRTEVASKFFAPPPAKMLSELVRTGLLTQEQAQLAEHIPVAQDLTGEADSGGHTDNRPQVTLIPTMLGLRDRAMAQYQFAQPLRVGAAGGIATPGSIAAAFAMGAGYVLVGSINQACVESGTCDDVRKMLAAAEEADTTMCPAADMFEMGVKVQVLKRGTMFAMRATKLYEVYRDCASIEEIPAAERANLEKTIFKTTLDDVWNQTVAFFKERDPVQVTKGEKDPKHKMALIFRWYLGQASRWANQGVPDRRLDYQIWCGPAMGAFNNWTRGTFLEKPENRRVGLVGYNLMYGGAVMTRLNALRSQGFPIPEAALHVPPRELGDVMQRLGLA